ncbi:unnamed protein product [Darwinula stevensoni]|uniref:guanylate cyclase n=1 Tax=Darwinula stevensoni TaxID=69355 RepID=A0A7R8X5C4_9CRUS|nr:unnamed protein product [Darwinula stevensoni]CAG0884510.1 unnamed protein product [Darwinula stevensoni]
MRDLATKRNEKCGSSLKLEYGEETWYDILEAAGAARNIIFSTHKIYPDDLIAKIGIACAEMTDGTAKTEDFLEFFGRCFVRQVQYWSHYGYDKFAHATGRYYRDFLKGIDNIHHQMRFSYPKMLSPSMYLAQENAQGAILHYKSKRRGFAPYVMGQLTQVAKDFYEINLEIEVVEVKELKRLNQINTIFALRFDNRGYVQEIRNQLMSQKAVSRLPHVRGSVVLSLFPFSVVFNKDLQIVDVGIKLKEILGSAIMLDAPVSNFFVIRRPRMDWDWDSLLQFREVMFEVEVVHYKERRLSHESSGGGGGGGGEGLSVFDGPGFRRRASMIIKALDVAHIRPSNHIHIQEDDGDGNEKSSLLLRGQMRFINEWDAITFLCMPLIGDLQELQELGLYLTDLSMHDLSREMVLAGWQHNSRLEVSYEKQEERSARLEESLNLLDQWKQRSDELLYSMIPQSVADKLRNGDDPINTCQSFDAVTVMFLELLLLTEESPMEMVTCMNTVFSLLDTITDEHNVYKVSFMQYPNTSHPFPKRKNAAIVPSSTCIIYCR